MKGPTDAELRKIEGEAFSAGLALEAELTNVILNHEFRLTEKELLVLRAALKIAESLTAR